MEKCKYCEKIFKTKTGRISHEVKKHKKEFQNSKMNTPVKIGEDVIDITYGELERLRKGHSNKCDICVKYETANTHPGHKTDPNRLCVDHDHNTKKFRGFVCVQCNRNMGWIDKYSDEIIAYNKAYAEKVSTS